MSWLNNGIYRYKYRSHASVCALWTLIVMWASQYQCSLSMNTVQMTGNVWKNSCLIGITVDAVHLLALHKVVQQQFLGEVGTFITCKCQVSPGYCMLKTIKFSFFSQSYSRNMKKWNIFEIYGITFNWLLMLQLTSSIKSHNYLP